MTIHIAPFDPHTASDELWAAFNATRRALSSCGRTSRFSMTRRPGGKS
jgi:hypothetical protein